MWGCEVDFPWEQDFVNFVAICNLKKVCRNRKLFPFFKTVLLFSFVMFHKKNQPARWSSKRSNFVAPKSLSRLAGVMCGLESESGLRRLPENQDVWFGIRSQNPKHQLFFICQGLVLFGYWVMWNWQKICRLGAKQIPDQHWLLGVALLPQLQPTVVFSGCFCGNEHSRRRCA